VVAFAQRHGRVLAVAGALAVLVAMVVVLAGNWGDFADAAVGAPMWMLALAVVGQVLALASRTEAWSVSVRCAGGTVGRRRLFRSAGFGYLGNVVNAELGYAMRVASLRRTAPGETPHVLTLAVTEAPIIFVELGLAALFSFTLVEPLGLPWWIPIGAFAVLLAGLAGLRRLVLAHDRGWWQGLAVMREAGPCARIVVFVTLSICLQIARNWLVLQAVGLDASVLDATALIIALAGLSVLPLGPSLGASATVLILGADGVAATAAGGALLTFTGAAGATLYAAWAFVDRFVAGRTAAGPPLVPSARARAAAPRTA
jgi:uncharacterized membrane protein YbhN (UPF0104 family)